VLYLSPSLPIGVDPAGLSADGAGHSFLSDAGLDGRLGLVPVAMRREVAAVAEGAGSCSCQPCISDTLSLHEGRASLAIKMISTFFLHPHLTSQY
jgi:hypothetical protein